MVTTIINSDMVHSYIIYQYYFMIHLHNIQNNHNNYLSQQTNKCYRYIRLLKYMINQDITIQILCGSFNNDMTSIKDIIIFEYNYKN